VAGRKRRDRPGPELGRRRAAQHLDELVGLDATRLEVGFHERGGGETRHARLAYHVVDRAAGPARARDASEVSLLAFLEPEGREVALEDAGGRLHGLVRDLLGRVRVRERVGEVEPRLRVIGLQAEALVQTSVLEGNRGVPGEHLEQPQV
jgi:hypothetical protein